MDSSVPAADAVLSVELSRILIADVPTGVEQTTSRIAGKMLQVNRDVIGGKQRSRALGPLDEHERV